MAQREGSIYLTLFIVMFLLFVGMTFLFIQSNAQNTQQADTIAELEDEIDGKEESIRSRNETVRDLQQLIGGPAFADQRWPGNSVFEERLRETVQTALADAQKDLGATEAAREYTHLVEPYEDVVKMLRIYRDQLAKAVADRRGTNEAREAEKLNATQAIDEIRGESEKHLNSISALESRVEEIDAAGKEKEQELLAQIEEIKEAASDVEIQLRRELNFKDNTIKALENRLAAFEEEVRKAKSFDDVEPDGTILEVLADSGKAWIDKGLSDHVNRGLPFRVFQHGKAGKRIYKGVVEVRKVDDSTSEVRILEEVDALNPIAPGDFIASPFYDPEESPTFVFAGESGSSRYSQDYLVARVESLGGSVQKKS